MLSDIRKRISEGESVEDVLKKYVKPDGKYIYFCSRGADVKELQDRISSIYKDVDYEFYYVHSNEQSTQVNNLNSNNFYNNKTMDGESARGKLRIMFALDMYNEGIHVPDIDGVIMGRSTSSDILFYQQLGRALAVKGDSSQDFHPLVIDLVNNIGAIEELYNKVLQEKENSKEQIFHEEREKEERDLDNFNMAINFGLSDEIIDVLDALNKLNNTSGISELTFEEKLEEAYEYLQKNKSLPNTNDKQKKFSDGVLMGAWFNNNKSKLEEISKDNEQAKAILYYLENKDEIIFQNKMNETYDYLQEYDNLPFLTNRQVKFSDGTLMVSWLSNNKLKLEEMTQNNEKARAIANELKRRKGLSFEEKLEEVYEYLQEYGELPIKENKQIKFSDGVLMGSWIMSKKEILKKLSQSNGKARFIIDYLDNKKDFLFQRKLDEVYDYMRKYGILPSKNDKDVYFSDGKLMGTWLYNKSNNLKISKIAENDEKAKLILYYREHRDEIIFQKKLNEMFNYIVKYGAIPIQKNKSVFSVDDTFMGKWLYRNKQKIYELYLKGDELALKFVSAVLEINPNYFDSVKKVIEAKCEFEKGNEKEASNGPKI